MKFRGIIKSTFRVIPAPNQTSPVTFKLSRSMMLGIDLNRLKKLSTCVHKSQHITILKQKAFTNLMQIIARNGSEPS